MSVLAKARLEFTVIFVVAVVAAASVTTIVADPAAPGAVYLPFESIVIEEIVLLKPVPPVTKLVSIEPSLLRRVR